MTVWRALTVKQPWSWSICFAGKDVENRVWPIPPKHLMCRWCFGTGVEPMTSCKVCSVCDDGPVPFRVMLHAGKQWDRDAITKNQYGGKFWTPPTMEMLTLLEWCEKPIHADPCECDEDEGFLDGRCADLSAADMKQAFAPDPGAHMYNPIGMGTTKPWCKRCAGTDWVGRHDGHECDCRDEPVEDYNAWVAFGAVVAVVEFTGSHHADSCRGFNASDTCTPIGEEWAQTGDVYHWEIGDVTVLDTPVPARGHQRLWIPDAEIIEAVEVQL